MSYNTDLQQNNTELQDILDMVNALPNASGGNTGGDEISLQEKSVTPTKTAQTVTADSGYDGLSKVNVGAIPSEYIIPSGTKSITENGTHDAKAFESVTVNVPIPDGYIQPSGTKEITENGTHDVTSYASVSVDVSTGGGSGNDDVGALLSGTLTVINSNATSVMGYACRGRTALLSVDLPLATSIGTYGFHSCSNMTEFNAQKVTSLGSYAFYQCKKLEYVRFPFATSVPSSCFYQCTSLRTVDLGAAKSIAAYGFIYCSSLRTLILRRSDAICTLANTTNCFSSSGIQPGGLGYIYVPSALIDSYKVATNWSTYADQFRAIEDYPDIEYGGNFGGQ